MKNPKNKLKNILLLITMLFAFSCSKDVYEEELLNENITKKKISFNEFSTNKKAFNEFTIAKNELQSASFESTSFERAAYNQDLNIVIDTDNIQLIEIDDYRTYTIPFLAEGRENKVDNMVIVENGNYIDVKFISYNLTKQQLSQMNFGTIDNTILFRNNNAIETECNTIVDKAEIYINPATGQISGYIVTYANPCAGTEGNTYVIQQIDSDGSTGGDGNGGDGSSGNFSSGNNSGILNFWSNLFGNNYSNGGPGSGEIYTLGNGSNGSNASNIGGVTYDNWDNTTVLTNPVISTGINMQNATLMLEIGAYLNQLKQDNPQLNQLLLDNPNIYQYISNYALQNVPFKQDVKNAITLALNNFSNFQLNSTYPNLTNVNIDKFNSWAFYTYLNNNPLNVNNIKINNIKGFVQSTDFETSNEIADYLYENKDSQEAIDRVISLIDPSVSANLISYLPTFKYPSGSNYSSLYPKLTEYLKNKIPLLKNNQFIINKLVKYSELTKEQIIKDLKWGEGPIIQIAQLNSYSTECYGIFSSATPNVLTIDIDFVNLLENSSSGSVGDSLAFLLGVTILHEYVHLGDFVDGIDQPDEEGLSFEHATYGETIWIHNAGSVLIKWQ